MQPNTMSRPAGRGLLNQAVPEDDVPVDDVPVDENDPTFQAAVSLVQDALYANNGADAVAEGLRRANDPVQGLADTAYSIAEVVDERTEGNVPDELIVLLGITILEEVAEIGEAAGLTYTPEQLADAFKRMLLRFLQEQGHDVSQLEQAMAGIGPEAFANLGADDAPETTRGAQ